MHKFREKERKERLEEYDNKIRRTRSECQLYEGIIDFNLLKSNLNQKQVSEECDNLKKQIMSSKYRKFLSQYSLTFERD